MQIHRVRENEGIYDIGREYGVSPIKISENNEIDIKGRLASGRELLILMPTRTYNVRKGDTLENIGKRFGSSSRLLRTLNPELHNNDSVYTGQLLALKYDMPTYGMGAANGYYYSGCPRDKLMRALPYMSYMTVCSAKARNNGELSMMFDDRELTELASKNRIIPLMRIYVPDYTIIGIDRFIDSAVILAKSHGYMGITLSGGLCGSGISKEVLCDMKRKLMDCGLILFTESDIRDGCTVSELFDGVVLSYDKIHLDDIPTFDDGERAAMVEYAERCDSMNAFIDLSPFAYCEGKYIDKGTAFSVCDRNRARLEHDEEKMILTGELGRGRRARSMRCESLENTKAKLALAGELGYMGISFDIMRTPLAELLIFSAMFSMPPVSVSAPKCNP